MVTDPEIQPLAAPRLFENFVECRTRGQRRRQALGPLKFAVKWLLNWKGARGT